MSIKFNQYLIDFKDGTQDYLTAEDLEEVFEWVKEFSDKDEVLAIYKCVWEPEDEETGN